MQHSEDVNSASIGGLIQPIRRHLGEPAIERAAFQLEPGQVSAVIPVNNQFAILKCEGKVPPRGVTLESVQEELSERIKEEKLRQVAADLFGKLQAAATIQNVYNDPTLRNAMPGVVATVNGNQITMQELGVECLARHGEAVLEMEISHLLLQQELKKANTAVSEADLQAEMTHAAELSGVLDAAGKPDLAQWVKVATQDQGITYEMYVRDSVWPSVALKKITSGKVQVSPEDMQKGFAANYGERVRCRAIVLSDMRRARKCGTRRAPTKASNTSAIWRPSIRSSPPAKRFAAKCRRCGNMAGSPNSKRSPSKCSQVNFPAWCRWATSTSS